MEEECEFRERLKSGKSPPLTTTFDVDKLDMRDATSHRLWPEIEQVVKEQVSFARLGVGEAVPDGTTSESSMWQLFAEDGDMRMYRREVEVDGMVVDPLKACHVVRGVTGRELCHYFFRYVK